MARSTAPPRGARDGGDDHTGVGANPAQHPLQGFAVGHRVAIVGQFADVVTSAPYRLTHFGPEDHHANTLFGEGRQAFIDSVE